jgi:hypothetical protein
LLKLLCRWRSEADQSGRVTKRIVVAHEAGRYGMILLAWRFLQYQKDSAQ